MQVVSIENLNLSERKFHAREGRFRSYLLLEGKEGTPGNFSLKLSQLSSDFKSPRHRHNFDQIRYLIEGHYEYGTDGPLPAGWIGYFPEGTPYGPQTVSGDSRHLILQFGGASGSGYLSETQYEATMEKLTATARFERGFMIIPQENGTTKRKDGYEAIWEALNGRKLIYPPQRYAKPIFINPESFDWLPDARSPGVEHRNLGRFTEAGTEIAFHRLQDGSKAHLPGHSVYFVVDGAGSTDGSALTRHSAFFAERSEPVPVAASQPLTLVRFGLPDVG